MMKLYENGDFLLHNLGNRPIYVDGKSVIKGDRAQLQNNSVIEIGLIILHFTRNENYKRTSVVAQVSQQHQQLAQQQSLVKNSTSSKVVQPSPLPPQQINPMSPKTSLIQAQSLLSIQLQQKSSLQKQQHQNLQSLTLPSSQQQPMD